MIAAGDPEWAVHYASDEPTPSPVNRLKTTTYHHAGGVISCVELKDGFLTAAPTIQTAKPVEPRPRYTSVTGTGDTETPDAVAARVARSPPATPTAPAPMSAWHYHAKTHNPGPAESPWATRAAA